MSRRRLVAVAVAAVALAAFVGFGLWLGRAGIVAAGALTVLVAFVAIPAVRLRGWRRIAGALGGLVAFVAVTLVFVKLLYGRGEPYPDRSTAPLLPASAVTSLVTLDYPPGNVAIAPDGRTFFNYHPFAKAERFVPSTMFELVGGAPRPYPDASFSYQGVFGMTVDRQHRLWLIEPAGIDHARTRLLAFDLTTNTLAFEHWFPEGEGRFAQDLRVSPDGATVYLADTGMFQFTRPSLIVLDVATKTDRRVLATAPQIQPQDWVITTPFGPHKLAYGLVTFTVGLDGIEISADGAYLYLAAMSNDHLYKLPTAALRGDDIDPESQLVDLGVKPLSDGITVDRDGAVVLTDIEHGGLARLDAHGLRTLVRLPGVIWADGVVVAPDGALVFTDSAIPAYIDQLARPPSEERLVAARPYHIYRVASQSR
jgi:sugar lactone lactonase YvrE